MKSSCKHVVADSVVRKQNKCERHMYVSLTGDVTGENVTGAIEVFKKDEYL